MSNYTDKNGETVTVLPDVERSMFEIRDEQGQVAGHADFRQRDDDRVFHHTVVDERFGGRGLGTALVRGAVEATRAEGKTIVPVCSMVKGFLEKSGDEFAGAYRLPSSDDLTWVRAEVGEA